MIWILDPHGFNTLLRGAPLLIFYLTPNKGESAVKRTFALRGHPSAPDDPTMSEH